jgi:hypothetical protein
MVIAVGFTSDTADALLSGRTMAARIHNTRLRLR